MEPRRIQLSEKLRKIVQAQLRDCHEHPSLARHLIWASIAEEIPTTKEGDWSLDFSLSEAYVVEHLE